MQFRNVVRRILQLHNCEKVGRVVSVKAILTNISHFYGLSNLQSTDSTPIAKTLLHLGRFVFLTTHVPVSNEYTKGITMTRRVLTLCRGTSSSNSVPKEYPESAGIRKRRWRDSSKSSGRCRASGRPPSSSLHS